VADPLLDEFLKKIKPPEPPARRLTTREWENIQRRRLDLKRVEEIISTPGITPEQAELKLRRGDSDRVWRLVKQWVNFSAKAAQRKSKSST
jgi:hypothetical protein